MTNTALTALRPLADQIIEVGGRLNERDWNRPSACPGWSVQDVFIHLTCTLREVAAPDTLPEPVPGSVERSNDAAVIHFRTQSAARTLEDYRQLIEPALAGLAEMQLQPAAEETVDFDDAGQYPAHLVADSLVFDHYCHLRHDLAGRGPLHVDVTADEPTMHASLTWLMAGLPQMSPPHLASALLAPVELHLTGPGGGNWTLQPTNGNIAVIARKSENPAARITSTAEDFLLWGTHRISHFDAALTTDGDRALADKVASAIHVF